MPGLLDTIDQKILESRNNSKTRCLTVLRFMLTKNMTLKEAENNKDFPLHKADSDCFVQDEELKELLQQVLATKKPIEQVIVFPELLRQFLEALKTIESDGSLSDSSSSTSLANTPRDLYPDTPSESLRGNIESASSSTSWPNTPTGTPRRVLEEEAGAVLGELKNQTR